MENFYLLLGFSVETFISDQQKCLEMLERKAKEWNASNSIQIRTKSETYYKSGIVRSAILDSTKWADQFFDAKQLIDEKIRISLFTLSGTGYVSEEELKRLSGVKELNVSVAYITRIAASAGIRVKKNSRNDLKKLSDYEPANINKFKSPSKQLAVLGCEDYYDFLNRYAPKAGAGGRFVPATGSGLCASAADRIQSHWDDKAASAEKSAVEQLCVAVKGFSGNDSDISQENYNRFLAWQKLKAVLDQLWNSISIAERKVINDKIFEYYAGKLDDIIHDKRSSGDILTSFCKEKGIEVPEQDDAEPVDPTAKKPEKPAAAPEKPAKPAKPSGKPAGDDSLDKMIKFFNENFLVHCLDSNSGIDHVHLDGRKETICGRKMTGLFSGKRYIDMLPPERIEDIKCPVCRKIINSLKKS